MPIKLGVHLDGTHTSLYAIQEFPPIKSLEVVLIKNDSFYDQSIAVECRSVERADNNHASSLGHTLTQAIYYSF